MGVGMLSHLKFKSIAEMMPVRGKRERCTCKKIYAEGLHFSAFIYNSMLHMPSLSDASDYVYTSRLEFNCHEATPEPLYRGTITSYQDTVYCSTLGSDIVHQYNTITCKWSILPTCPVAAFALVVIQGRLVAVGGQVCTNNGKHLPTDSMYSYTVTPYGSTVWTMYYPPMPTKRSYCAAICYTNTLIVAGGQTTYIHSAHCLNTIDLMDIHTHIWSKALPLPWPIRSPSLAIHGSILYVAGGWDDSGNKLLKLDMNIIVSTSRPLISPPRPSKIGDCQIMAWEV